ncbi:DtxR family iron (metal) dependent repressor [Mobilisporobacter senegalensis]|uniref:Manganese transport regulator n=1 Tax=Mobilisporobacter senegalensis TaxID=1329262 RepID=A0A3N1XM62_9FIRM|nr:iron dependent repressor, metal binding and dimerization domain protein [Mobilisporobacter senegalensis]ROR27231.1 DtxR family iron (metal) dependent repressor [Mobilisporobacter senegalensis]
MDNNDFHTFSESMKKDGNVLTASMEDYLEMIYRLSLNTGFTRIHELSAALNIQPPSATKMVQKMNELGLIKYEKYGYIMLEENGRVLGKSLLKRHETIETLLRLLGVPEDVILLETEKMEHTISSDTICCFDDYIDFVNMNPDITERFKDHQSHNITS